MSGKLASFILRLLGWYTVFILPSGRKSVVIVYPHTFNWDFPLGVLFRAKYQLNLQWAGKDDLFRWPLKGGHWLGGVPINRRQRTGMIAQLTRVFGESESFHPRFFISLNRENRVARI